MLRKSFFATLAVLGLAATSQAGVIISQSSAPAVNLPGYSTWTLTATTNDGSQIQGFDFASLPTYGFFGGMNQVNPAGAATIFQDSNGFFSFVPGADVSQDSQFKFKSSDLTVPAGFASESATQLRAVFASSAPLGTSVSFVQLAIPNALVGTVAYLGQVQTVVGSAVTNNDVVGTVGVNIPEPASITLIGLACAGLGSFRRRK
jgi:hypothetical protein